MSQQNAIEFPDDGPDALFKLSLAEGNFRIQQCQGCSKHIYYPRIICPKCGSNKLARKK